MDNVKWMKLLKDEHPKRYMALVLFKELHHADIFYTEFSGKRYASFGEEDNEEKCNICFVDEVRIHNNSGYWEIMKISTKDGSLREWKEDEEGREEKIDMQLFEEQEVQLPSCPVCLERLDPEVSGIITTYCAHDFHIKCLERWGDSCPVCRYTGEEMDASCSTCGSVNNLWLCLTCGHVGCGRYEKAHARDHFIETGHTFAIDIEKKTVWDYHGDQYIHRLIESKLEEETFEDDSGPGLADLSSTKKQIDNDLQEARLNSKIDTLAQEYNELLAQQLTKQRVYFESRLRDLEHEKDVKLLEKDRHIQSLEQKLRNAHAKKDQDQKLKQLQKQVKELESKEEFLQQLNEQLLANRSKYNVEKKKLQEKHQAELDKCKQELTEAKEFNNQLMMHLEAQSKIHQSSHNGQEGGEMLILRGPNEGKKTHKRNGRRR